MRIVVIDGHPDRSERHLCGALADAYIEGAIRGGHQVRRIDLAAFTFPMLQSQKQFESGQYPEELGIAINDIRWSEHLVFIFPLWLGTMPALLKAFLEQVMRPGVAFEYAAGGTAMKTLLHGRSARIIVTMGMPAILYRLWFLNHGVATLRRGILNIVGIRPVRQSLFGGVEAVSDAKRKQWIARVRRYGEMAK